jgi:hypothetical protein
MPHADDIATRWKQVRSRVVKLITEYLGRSDHFERMAKKEADPTLKERLLKQAVAYRKLATERAAKLNLPLPDLLA